MRLPVALGPRGAWSGPLVGHVVPLEVDPGHGPRGTGGETQPPRGWGVSIEIQIGGETSGEGGNHVSFLAHSTHSLTRQVCVHF